MLFVGSSSIRYWDLARAFPGKRVIKRGFGGSHVSDNIYFADRIIVPYEPALIVFYAGDADVAAGKTADQIGADYQKLVALIHARLPGATTLIIGTKPSPAHWAHAATIRAANDVARQSRQGPPHVRRRRERRSSAWTPPRAEFYAENGLNLNEPGYAAWIEAVCASSSDSGRRTSGLVRRRRFEKICRTAPEPSRTFT